MITRSFLAAGCAVTTLVIYPLVTRVSAASPANGASPTPAELVAEALRSELDGPSEARKTLLDRALALDPNFAPARWPSGYVRYDNQWLTVDEVARRAAADRRLAAYHKLRENLVDSAESHRQMARWCRKSHLLDEARIHWAKVLEFNPQDAEAIQGLGLQPYKGRLLTKNQIAEARHQADERQRALRHWKPKLEAWRKAIESGNSDQREAALAALRNVHDADALEALEIVFHFKGSSERANELNRLFIETVGQIPSPEATQVLIHNALSGSESAAACDELKKRPLFAYVPQLIAAMPPLPTWRAIYHVNLLSTGVVSLTVDFEPQDGQSNGA